MFFDPCSLATIEKSARLQQVAEGVAASKRKGASSRTRPPNAEKRLF
jgi:hypothetical protein